jgi:hypothetical protein
MACLEAVGGLGAATSFPDTIDLARLRSIRRIPLNDRVHWSEIHRELARRDADRALRRAIRIALRRTAKPTLRDRLNAFRNQPRRSRARRDPGWSDARSEFSRRWTNTAISLVRDGAPPE